MPAPPPVSQVVRRPVYNDTGEVIPYSVIVERTDPSGAKGAVIGSLVGFLVGGAVGWEVGNGVECGTGSGLFGTYDLCSPREEALRRAWRGIGMVAGTFFGAWIGHEGDQVTWLEAIRKIRGRGIAP
jgi:hypothetical protein